MKKVMDLDAGELGKLTTKELDDRITTELSEAMFFWMLVLLCVCGMGELGMYLLKSWL